MEETTQAFILGIFFGAFGGSILVYLINIQTQRKQNQLIELLKGSFSQLSIDVLSKSQENFLQLANQRFETQTKNIIRTRCDY